ncbi:hypothetical protein EON65_38055 [archaeon]|nr:MAG: hypothetical protein EON65_38055 [archaeon]
MSLMVLQGLQRMSSQDVLSLSPYSLTKQLGLNQLLPVGRLNGFTNMLLLVQELLRQQEKKLLDGLVNTSSSGRSAVRLTAVSAEEFKSVESLE